MTSKTAISKILKGTGRTTIPYKQNTQYFFEKTS